MKFISMIYPHRCAGCDEAIPEKEKLCRKCAATLRPISGDTCMKCGKRVLPENMYCRDCSRKIHFFDRGFAVFDYGDIKESLYRFKYSGRVEYGDFYGYAAYRVLKNVIGPLSVQALVPVPIHKKRRRKRGYNQAEVFAKALSYYFGIPVLEDLIARTQNTVPLKVLGEQERKDNLKRAFTIVGNDVKLKTIIIVDDIYTTGATIDRISKLLKESGIEKIYFITVAIGNGI